MPIKISPAEWEVLNVLWDRAPATAAEIFEALPQEKEWHVKTVNTFLARLVEKGVLQVRREGRSNVYVPRKTREQCIEAEGESFDLHRQPGRAGADHGVEMHDDDAPR